MLVVTTSPGKFCNVRGDRPGERFALPLVAFVRKNRLIGIAPGELIAHRSSRRDRGHLSGHLPVSAETATLLEQEQLENKVHLRVSHPGTVRAQA